MYVRPRHAWWFWQLVAFVIIFLWYLIIFALMFGVAYMVVDYLYHQSLKEGEKPDEKLPPVHL